MKKKIFLMIMLCGTILSMTACMSGGVTDQNGENTVSVNKEKSHAEKTRIVSVDKIKDYVTIAPYKGIELDSISKEITDEMVEARISKILEEASAEIQGNKAAIENGDIVTASYVGTINGKSFEGGTVTHYDWIVGSGEMYPEFDEAVLGMKRGETKKITCTFPKSYHSEILAGNEVLFTVNIQSIRRAPELDKKWVLENSDVKTVEKYKETVRAALETEIETIVENELKNIAWEKIITNSEMLEYPEKDIETAKVLFNARMSEYAKTYNMSLEEFIESQGMSMAEYEEQCQLYAERKVKQNLIVQGIIDEEKISLDDEVSLKLQDSIMKEYGAESLAELVDMYSQVQIDESIALLRVEDFIYKNAVIVEPFVAATEETTAEEAAAEDTAEEAAAEEAATEEAATEDTATEDTATTGEES